MNALDVQDIYQTGWNHCACYSAPPFLVSLAFRSLFLLLTQAMPLRLALVAHRRHQTLKGKLVRRDAEIKKLTRQLHNLENHAIYDSTTAEAVEKSLLTRLEELKEDYTSYVSPSCLIM